MEQIGMEDGDANPNVIVCSIVKFIIAKSNVTFKSKHLLLVHFHHFSFSLALAVLKN